MQALPSGDYARAYFLLGRVPCVNVCIVGLVIAVDVFSACSPGGYAIARYLGMPPPPSKRKVRAVLNPLCVPSRRRDRHGVLHKKSGQRNGQCVRR